MTMILPPALETIVEIPKTPRVPMTIEEYRNYEAPERFGFTQQRNVCDTSIQGPHDRINNRTRPEIPSAKKEKE